MGILEEMLGLLKINSIEVIFRNMFMILLFKGYVLHWAIVKYVISEKLCQKIVDSYFGMP